MKWRTISAVVVLAGLVALAFEAKVKAQSDLHVVYGNSGVQQLSYKGSVLEDLSQNASDAFHIWHMKMTDLSGNVLTSGEYGWGETNNGRTWNSAGQTWTYQFVWGTITVQFAQSGNTLNMNVTETNFANSGVILDGAVIYPLVLHFPRLPNGFIDPSYGQLAYNTTGPSVTLADFGTGEVAAVVPDASKPLYSGFQPTGQGISYFPIISGTTPDGLATFQPHSDRPVAPGQTDSFTVSLRFAPSGTPTTALASDAYQSWAKTWPPAINWTDRRAIGTVYLASSPQGNVNQPGGYPNNPRRYFNDSNPSDFDVTTTVGLANFQAKVLQQANNNVTNLKGLNAQGAITWDIEGEQYPQSTSYVCEPDEIAQVAPEMESTITDSSSAYFGMKLDDAYFKIMRNAGFRVGVCIRPQHFTLNGNGTAQQVFLPDADIPTELIRKMKYAHDRWGATLFYVDSTVESDGAVLDAGIFQQVAAALPDSLIMPEESTPKYYAYTAPFLSFIFHGDLGTSSTIYSYYPHAFSVNLINDVDPGTLAANLTQLTNSVRNGDILMVHADYWQANNPTIVQIYQNAGVGGPAPTPPPTTPSTPPVVPAPPVTTSEITITAPTNGAALSGAISVTAQVNATLDAAGSYLMVDGMEVGTQRVTGSPYIYPLDTRTLADGQHTLQLWAHDTGNNTVLSSTVSVMTANAATSSGPPPPTIPPPPTTPPPSSPAIALTQPLTGQVLSGLVAASAMISQTLDAAGSYLMVDGVEVGAQRVVSAPYVYNLDTTMLGMGQHVLQVWAHDIGNNTLLSNQAIVTVDQQ